MSRRAGKDQTELQKSFMTRLLHGLDGMKPLKAMAREGNLGPVIEADINGLNRAQRTIIVSREAVSESQEIIRVLAVAAGLYFFLTVWVQPVDGLFLLALLFARTLQKVSLLQQGYQNVMRDQPAFAFLQSTIAAADRAREPDLSGKKPCLSSAFRSGMSVFPMAENTFFIVYPWNCPPGSSSPSSGPRAPARRLSPI